MASYAAAKAAAAVASTADHVGLDAVHTVQTAAAARDSGAERRGQHRVHGAPRVLVGGRLNRDCGLAAARPPEALEPRDVFWGELEVQHDSHPGAPGYKYMMGPTDFEGTPAAINTLVASV